MVTRWQLITAAALVVAVAAGLALNRFLVTDDDRIKHVLNEVRDAAARGDVDGIFAHMPRDNAELTQLRGIAERFFAGNGAVDAKIMKTAIKKSGDIAIVVLDLSANSSKKDYGIMGRARLQVRFRRETGNVWRVSDVKPLRLGMQEVAGWGDLDRNAGW